MAEETEQTVKTVSDGTVTIAVEKYHELLGKAAEKPPVIYNTVEKTPAMASEENQMWGAVFMGAGAALGAIGALVYRHGRVQASRL